MTIHVTITHKHVGAPASNQYGRFAVKPATVGQQKFIAKLLEERDHQLGELDPATVALKEASSIIDHLLRLPVKSGKEPLASDRQLAFIEALKTQREGAEAYVAQFMNGYGSAPLTAYGARMLIDTLLTMPNLPARQVQVEVGAYLYNGIVYSLRKSPQSGKLHAYHWNDQTSAWDYSGNVKYELRPEHRLSFVEASNFGALTGTCVHCGRTLTDAKSVRIGLGTSCRKKYQ